MRIERGFSLAEVMVAIAVLAVGILGICSTLALGGRAEGQAARYTESTAYCRQILDLIRARNLAFTTFPNLPTAASGLNDATAGRVPLNAAPFASDMPGGTPYTRNIRVEWVNSTAGDYRNGMVRITAGIYWWDRGSEHKVEFQTYHRQP